MGRRVLRLHEGLLGSCAHSWTHPEGWRDWPDETPATTRRASDENGANSCEMWPEDFQTTSATHRRRFFDGSHRTEVPRLRRDLRGGGALRVHPLLRARGGRLRPHGARGGPRGAPAPHPGRPAEPVALRRPAAGRGPWPRRPAAARPHAARARRPAGRAPRTGRGVGQERHRQPDALVQGPRGRDRRPGARSSWASTRSAAARRGTWPTPSPRGPPRSGCRATSSSRPTSRSRRSSATPPTGRPW